METEILKKCRLFQGVDEKTLALALEMSREHSLRKNEVLQSEKGIYVIAEGKLGVYHCEEEHMVLFNTLGVSDVFGYASLYSDAEDGYTEIKALGACKLLFIDEKSVERLISESGKIALEIIKELTVKIRFLNKKLDSFATGDLRRRLWKYIESLDYDPEGRARLPEGMTSLARRLGVGRASLYRIMSDFIKEGLIKKDGNVIMKIKADKNV